ncbi:unnamed protein product [Penicillium salamii]|nr:unnamed protein product [Penicillium salamii]
MRSTCSFFQNKGLNFLRGLIILDDWEGQLQGVKNSEASLIQDSNRYNQDHARDSLGRIFRTGEATQKTLGSINQTLQDYIAAQKNSQTDSERNCCLRALRVVDPKDTIAKIEGIRDEVLWEAYSWILSTHEYRRFVEWTDKQQGRVLWIHGPAGTGKTMLFIGIIRELEAARAVYAPSMSYFFCENDNEKTNTPTAVLRSLIWLLLLQQPHLFSHILQDYKTSGADIFRDANAFWSLSRVFNGMLKDPTLGPTYLMIDALDECNKTASDGADLRLLKELISDSLGLTDNVRWLVTSRPEVRLNKDFQGFASGTIDRIDVQGQDRAVQAYIQHKLSEMQTRKTYQPSVIVKLAGELNSRANGIFLWVALIFRELRECDSWNVEKVLEDLPNGLTALYEMLMEKINSESRQTAQFCKNVLVASCLANRPLSADELGVCAGLPIQVPASEIVVKCGSFLRTRENDHTVYPLHQSVRDYLETSYMAGYLKDGPSQGHLEIFQRSIEKMSSILRVNMYGLPFDTLSEDVQPPNEDCLASIRYSCVYWVDHLCAIGSQSLRSGHFFSENGELLSFLQKHLLHWLESLSLINNFQAGIQSVRKLLSVVQSSQNKSSELIGLLMEAKRVVSRFRSIIEGAPLQIYGAPLLFCPEKTRIKTYFWKDRLPCIKEIFGLQHKWDPCIQVLELPRYNDDSNYEAYEWNDRLHVALSPDGKTVAGVYHGKLRLWDIATGLVKTDLRTKCSYVAFSADGRTLILVGTLGETQVWSMTDILSAASPGKTGNLWDRHDYWGAICIAPNGCTVARAPENGPLTIWNIGAATMRSTSETFSRVTALAYSADGAQIALATTDDTLQIWDAENVTCRRIFENHHNAYTSAIAFSPDCNWLAVASDGRTALWNIETGDHKIMTDDDTLFSFVAFSPNGRMIASSGPHVVNIYDTFSGKRVKTLTALGGMFNSITFSPDSQTLVTASEDSDCRVWDMKATDDDDDDDDADEGERSPPGCYGVSPDGKLFASGKDRFVHLREIASGACTITLELDSQVNAITFLSDSLNNTLATATLFSVQIWDLSAPKIRHTIEWHGVYHLACSYDGKFLAALSSRVDELESAKLCAKILNVDTGKWVQTLDGASDRQEYAFSHDGRYLAAESTIWEIATGVSRKLPPLNKFGLQFSKDDGYLFSYDRSLDLHSGELAPKSIALQRRPQGLLHVEREWVMKDAQRLFWLPSEYWSNYYCCFKSNLVFVNPFYQLRTSIEFV